MSVRFLLLFITLVIFSCSKNQSSSFPDEKSGNELDQTEPLPAISTDSIAEHPAEVPPPEIIPWEKKLIKNANLIVEVEDLKSFNNNLHALVSQYSGYIAAERSSYADFKNEVSVTIKVPTIRFEALLNELNNKASKTMERNISTQDVTGEMKDNKARLETKKETRLKYLEFLKQSKNINEVLKVQQEINVLQEQIESMSSTQNLLSHQTTFSTIQLNFYSILKDNSKPVETQGFSNRFIASIQSGISVIGEFIILLAKLWPFIFIGSVVWLIIKRKNLLKI